MRYEKTCEKEGGEARSSQHCFRSVRHNRTRRLCYSFFSVYFASYDCFQTYSKIHMLIPQNILDICNQGALNQRRESTDLYAPALAADAPTLLPPDCAKRISSACFAQPRKICSLGCWLYRFFDRRRGGGKQIYTMVFLALKCWTPMLVFLGTGRQRQRCCCPSASQEAGSLSGSQSGG